MSLNSHCSRQYLISELVAGTVRSASMIGLPELVEVVENLRPYAAAYETAVTEVNKRRMREKKKN